MAGTAETTREGASRVDARRFAPIAVAVLYFAVMMPFGSQLLMNYLDERYYAYAGARIVESGEWLIPRAAYGDVRLKKPIIPYWFSAAGFEVLGINAAGFRLFFVLGASLILVLTFALARTLGASPPVALFAELMLAGNPVFLRATVNAIPDLPLALFSTASALGFAGLLVAEEDRPARGFAWLAWLGAALAVLSKGSLPVLFVGFVLAFVTIVDRRRLRALLAPLPILAGALLVAGWYLYAFLAHPADFFGQFLTDQIGNKAAHDLLRPLIAFPGYLLVTLVSFMAWPFILVFGLFRAPRAFVAGWPPALKDLAVALIALVAIPCALAFVAARGPLPLIVPLAIILAVAVFGFTRASRPFAIAAWPLPMKLLAAWAVAVAAIFAIGGFVAGRYMLPVIPIVAALLALAIRALDGEGMPRVAAIARTLVAPVAVFGLLLVLLGISVEAQLAPAGEAVAFVVLGAAAWLAFAIAGRRSASVAPFLVAAAPVLAVAVLVPPAARLALPDIGLPYAERIAALGVAPERTVFVGDPDDALAIRLRVGRADPFREVPRLDDATIADACLVLTDESGTADLLRQRGFAVETVRAAWRKIDPAVLFRAIASGTLAEARRENGQIGFVATHADAPGCAPAAASAARP